MLNASDDFFRLNLPLCSSQLPVFELLINVSFLISLLICSSKSEAELRAREGNQELTGRLYRHVLLVWCVAKSESMSRAILLDLNSFSCYSERCKPLTSNERTRKPSYNLNISTLLCKALYFNQFFSVAAQFAMRYWTIGRLSTHQTRQLYYRTKVR